MKNTYWLLFALFLLLNSKYAHSQKLYSNSDLTSWTIKCKSIKTGRGKIFTGTPNDLSSFKKYFKEHTQGMENDVLAIEMKFNNTNVVLTDTLPYAKAVHFFKNHSFLLSDCEIFEYSGGGRGRSATLWDDPSLNSTNAVVCEVDTRTPAAEGDGSLLMQGTSAESKNKKYVCSLRRKIKSGEFYNISDPSSIWFSLYLKGELDSDAFFRLSVWQNDSGIIVRSPENNQMYYTDIPLNFTDWKQFAIRYSDMHPNKAIRNDNQTQNPQYISSIVYGLYTKDTTTKAQVNMDYLMILYDKPKSNNPFLQE
ncbi:MAG TPA: hypothetical protein VK766_09165 [Cytophagaceae bacterium]|jgi:hypothetical protein|nr:hypothetical protein [Cytophagaceae bacterium]